MLSPIDKQYQRIQDWEKVGDANAARKIVAALADPEPMVRGRAALTLGRMRVAEAVPALVERLEDADGPTRLKAVEALGRIGDPAAVPGLMRALENPAFSRLMMGMAPTDGSPLAANQLLRAQGDAWDLQWAAATALGRIGEPSCVAWVLHWAARLMLSAVRVFSVEEKAELVRGIVENLFPRLSPADIFDLSRTIHPAGVSISWEPVDASGEDFHWAAAIRDSPLHRLFKAELERRKMQYMKTLRGGSDTLFSVGQPQTPAGGRANAADTLFSGGGQAGAGAGGRANAADTLFSTPQSGANAADTLFQTAGDSGATLLSEYRRREDQLLGEADLDALRAMALRMQDQVEAFYFPTRVAGASGAEDPLAAESQLTVEEIQARIAAHQKTLGKSDTLFSTSHLSAAASALAEEEYDEGDALFLSEDQARQQQAPKRLPSVRADLPVDARSIAEKMAAHQKTLGKSDTLFSMAPAASSELPSNWMDDDDLFGDAPAPRAAAPAPDTTPPSALPGAFAEFGDEADAFEPCQQPEAPRPPSFSVSEPPPTEAPTEIPAEPPNPAGWDKWTFESEPEPAALELELAPAADSEPDYAAEPAPGYAPEPEPARPAAAFELESFPEVEPEAQPEPRFAMEAEPQPEPEPQRAPPEEPAFEPAEPVQPAAASGPSAESMFNFDQLMDAMLSEPERDRATETTESAPKPKTAKSTRPPKYVPRAAAAFGAKVPSSPAAASPAAAIESSPVPGPAPLAEEADEFETPVAKGQMPTMLLPHPIRDQLRAARDRGPLYPPPQAAPAPPVKPAGRLRAMFDRALDFLRALFRRK